MTEPEQVIGFIGAPDSGKTTIVNEVKAETEEPYQIQPPAGFRFLDFWAGEPCYVVREDGND